jgi:uncharacterized membrane protein
MEMFHLTEKEKLTSLLIGILFSIVALGIAGFLLWKLLSSDNFLFAACLVLLGVIVLMRIRFWPPTSPPEDLSNSG